MIRCRKTVNIVSRDLSAVGLSIYDFVLWNVMNDKVNSIFKEAYTVVILSHPETLLIHRTNSVQQIFRKKETGLYTQEGYFSQNTIS